MRCFYQLPLLLLVPKSATNSRLFVPNQMSIVDIFAQYFACCIENASIFDSSVLFSSAYLCLFSWSFRCWVFKNFFLYSFTRSSNFPFSVVQLGNWWASLSLVNTYLLCVCLIWLLLIANLVFLSISTIFGQLFLRSQDVIITQANSRLCLVASIAWPTECAHLFFVGCCSSVFFWFIYFYFRRITTTQRCVVAYSFIKLLRSFFNLMFWFFGGGFS